MISSCSPVFSAHLSLYHNHFPSLMNQNNNNNNLIHSVFEHQHKSSAAAVQEQRLTENKGKNEWQKNERRQDWG